MEKVTGKKVHVLPGAVERGADRGHAAGRLHITGFNTGPTRSPLPAPVSSPSRSMASADDTFGYEMEIITHPGSGIERVQDLKGKKLAFTSETSNSGFKAPSAILKAEYGLEARKDFEPVFSGMHDNSILGVANKDYPAAASLQLGHATHDRPRRSQVR